METFSCVLEKNVQSEFAEWRSVRSSWITVLFSSYFLVDHLSGCSSHQWKWSFEVSNYYYWVVYFSFNFISFYFMCFETLLLGAYIFIVAMSFWKIDPFIITIYPSLTLETIFFLKINFVCFWLLQLSFGYCIYVIYFFIIFLSNNLCLWIHSLSFIDSI